MLNIIRKVLFAAFLYAYHTSVAFSASIEFIPDKQNVSVGDVFNVDIVARGFTELAGGEFDLTYIDEVVEINFISIDPYWDFLPDGGVKSGPDSWSFVGFDTDVNAPATGDFTIATMNLSAITEGISTIDFDYTFFASSTEEIFPTLGSLDIRVSAIPVPAAAWLMLSGLGLLGFLSRNKVG